MASAIDEVLERMKAEAIQKARSNPRPLGERLESTYWELIKRHIQMQREGGVAVPSQRQAEEFVSEIMRKLISEGVV